MKQELKILFPIIFLVSLIVFVVYELLRFPSLSQEEQATIINQVHNDNLYLLIPVVALIGLGIAVLFAWLDERRKSVD